jgi:hypothetical protein
MRTFLQYLRESYNYTITPKDDGFVLKTIHGFIDYRPTENANEIWWIESKKRGHGSELVDLMQKEHPNTAIAWGVTSKLGEMLRKKWHRNNPTIESIHGEPHDGQFDPFG